MNTHQRSILLADDHAVVRKGLSAIIKKYTSHTVVAEVGNGLETIEQAQKHKPDLIIIDISMPDLNGLETISQIRKFLPDTKILVLSIYQDKNFVTSAVRLGASGYLLKNGGVEELVSAIKSIMEGRRYISPALSDIMADELMTTNRKQIKNGLEGLSARERQILSLIAGGARRGEIANRLHISTETVKTHRKNIMTKLHLHDQIELVKFAINNNLGPLPQ